MSPEDTYCDKKLFPDVKVSPAVTFSSDVKMSLVVTYLETFYEKSLPNKKFCRNSKIKFARLASLFPDCVMISLEKLIERV